METQTTERSRPEDLRDTIPQGASRPTDLRDTIPQDRKKVPATPKDFFLWVGAMIAFYVSVVAFINLIFQYINYLYPDPLNSYQIDPYQSGISAFMATLIVALPIYLILMRIIRRTIIRDPSRQETWVRRWALICTLFVAVVAFAITLVVLLTTFLSGEELTLRFLFKVLTVLLVTGASFSHFFADIMGYWKQFPDRARNIGFGVGAVVLATIIAGFFIVGTPQEARLARYDAQKVSDLQNIQWQIVNYWQQKEKLPKELSDLFDPISNNFAPVDPQTKNEYEYKETAPLSFQLCAVFNTETRKTMGGRGGVRLEVSPPMPIEVTKGETADNWQHTAGRVCFDRTIDPERYPPNSTPAKI